MKLNDLTPNPNNPRTVTNQKLSMLKKAIAKFGPLDGFVYNRKTQRLVSGHQRLKVSEGNPDVTITKKLSKPSKTGTVAEGYVVLRGERFVYREVFWPEPLEKAASIAANKSAGEWDTQTLSTWMKDLTEFDLNFDISLTMFDEDELSKLPIPIEVSAHTRKQKGEDKEKETGPAKCKAGQVFALGDSRLLCGSDDLHYCDLIISRWEKYSGNTAELMTVTKIKKTDKPSVSRHA